MIDLDANLIDKAARRCAADTPSNQEITDAAARVWSKIEAANQNRRLIVNAESVTAHNSRRLENCNDYQSLIPAYLTDDVSASHKLLFEDHTRECVACRRQLHLAKTDNFQLTDAPKGVYQSTSQANAYRVSSDALNNRPPRQVKRASLPKALAHQVASHRVAAAMTFACVLLAVIFIWQPSNHREWRMTVEAADGAVYQVGEADGAALSKNASINTSQPIRTAKDSRAVLRLTDGSQIEVAERSQLYLTATRDGAVINLERGQIIVEAARQQDNQKLFVRTSDALIAVKGTIFSVNSGTAGARVAVVEGAVEVVSNNETRVVNAGEQTATQARIEPVNPQTEIAWSSKSDEYRRLLNAAKNAGDELNRQTALPGKRYATRLLDMTPSNTIFYATLPNIGTQLTDAYGLLKTQIEGNPSLRAWYSGENKNRQADLDFLFARLRGWGAQLGDEVVLSASLNQSNLAPQPVLLAQVKDPTTFRNFLTAELATLSNQTGKAVPLRFIENDADLNNLINVPGKDASSNQSQTTRTANDAPTIYAQLKGDVLCASTVVSALRKVHNNSMNVSRDDFHARLTDAYRHGVNFLLAANLQELIARQATEQIAPAHASSPHTAAATPLANQADKEEMRRAEAAMFHHSGFDDLRFLIIEARETNDGMKQVDNRATVTFTGERRGMASWLAAPHAMGTLDYISPNATAAAAFVMKQPSAVVDDLIAMINTAAPNAVDHLEAAQAESNINLREDLAAPLGGEFAVAIDGALLPVPSWKFIVEVYDANRLQAALTRVVETVNAKAKHATQPSLTLTASQLNNRTYYTLKSALAPTEINYTFVDKYLIAAPSRALIEQALESKAAGVSLRTAPRFINGLPTGGEVNFSALIYQNVGDLVDTFAPYAARLGKDDTSDRLAKARGASVIAANAPALAYAQAYPDRIVFAMPSHGAPFGLTPAMLFGLPSNDSFGLRNVLNNASP